MWNFFTVLAASLITLLAGFGNTKYNLDRKTSNDSKKMLLKNLYSPFFKEYLNYQSLKLSIPKINFGERSPYLDIYNNTNNILLENYSILPFKVQELLPEFNALIKDFNSSDKIKNINNELEDIFQPFNTLKRIESLYKQISNILISDSKNIRKDLLI